MAIEDDYVVDAEFPEGDTASQPGRPRTHDYDVVDSRPFHRLIRHSSIDPFAHRYVLSLCRWRIPMTQND